MRADAVHGHLDLLVLSLLAEGPRHGYAISEEIRIRSRDEVDLREGTLYPALYRLEREGLLTSRWQTADGRRRRVYRLTRRGRVALRQRHEEWRTLARAIRQVIGDEAWAN